MISVEYLDHFGSDLSVVNAARVSFYKESDWDKCCDGGVVVNILCNGCEDKQLSERDTKLIKYLAEHEHTSPFNHCFVSFRVKAPIFVARQLVKHEYLPWNEVSRRYVDGPPKFYMPDQWRARADNVKQGSSETSAVESMVYSEYETGYGIVHHTAPVETVVSNLHDDIECRYQELLAAGVCPEQARMILPQSMMTEWVWSGSLGAFAKMCRLRLDSHSQLETRIIAEKISDTCRSLWPASWKAIVLDNIKDEED